MDRYIVSARKYRPENFTSVVGQASITHTLKNAIRNQQLSHAYLFCGPRGVGKTTCARILAKTINCRQITAETEPCNSCEPCLSFNESRAFNIHELDAASNNSVEDIRNLTEQVRIPPQVGKYSIYIIDEVHMLSAQAFNAFLKTLEEPPAHAIFILATTEKHKIIPTILSRCQIFDFNRIRVEDIVRYLEYIAGEEKVEYELDALNIVALKADGAMRDALSIFDQIVSFTGRHIRYSDVIENLNILDYEYYFRITDNFLSGDVPAALLLFNDVLAKGFDAHNFLAGLASHMRNLLVCRDPVTLELLEVGAGIRDRYREQSKHTDQVWLYHVLDILSEADISFKSSRNQRLHMEITLLKLCNLLEDNKKKVLTKTEAGSEPPVERNDGGQVLNSEESGIGPAGPGPDKKISQVTRKNIPGTTPSIKNALNGIGRQEKDTGPDKTLKQEKPVMSDPFTQEDLADQWVRYAEKIRTEKPRMASSLKHHMPLLKEDQTIEVILSNSAQFQQFDREIKPDLINFLESSLHNNQFRIVPILAEEEEKHNNLYTAEEKFNHMLRKNPSLGKLKERFNLDFD